MSEELESCPFLDAELLHCPFCGCDSARVFFIANKKLFFVFCLACHAQTAPDYYKDFAVSNWNDRAKKKKKMPMIDKNRPCIFDFGTFCYSHFTVYSEELCRTCDIYQEVKNNKEVNNE